MFGVELIDAQGLGRARQVVQRRIALKQRNRIAKIFQNRHQLAEAPDAGAIQIL